MLLQKGLENNSFVKDYSKNQFYGIYKHPNYQYLEKIVKDDFNTFHPIKFENENQVNNDQKMEHKDLQETIHREK